MSEETPEVISETPATTAQPALEGGAYEIIRARLDKHRGPTSNKLTLTQLEHFTHSLINLNTQSLL